MDKNDVKLYYDYVTEEVVNVLYDNEVYYVMRKIDETEEYVMYEIDQCQNAVRHYSECTKSRILVDFKDRRNICVLDGLHLNVVNR